MTKRDMRWTKQQQQKRLALSRNWTRETATHLWHKADQLIDLVEYGVAGGLDTEVRDWVVEAAASCARSASVLEADAETTLVEHAKEQRETVTLNLYKKWINLHQLNERLFMTEAEALLGVLCVSPLRGGKCLACNGKGHQMVVPNGFRKCSSCKGVGKQKQKRKTS